MFFVYAMCVCYVGVGMGGCVRVDVCGGVDVGVGCGVVVGDCVDIGVGVGIDVGAVVCSGAQSTLVTYHAYFE